MLGANLFPHFVSVMLTCSCCLTLAQELEWSPPESVRDLPEVADLPELMRFADGRAVQTTADWQRRRRELKAMVQYFEYGQLPPAPEMVNVAEQAIAKLPDCDAMEEKLRLVIGAEPAGLERHRPGRARPERMGGMRVLGSAVVAGAAVPGAAYVDCSVSRSSHPPFSTRTHCGIGKVQLP